MKRKLFIIQGNFQLKVVLCAVFILAAGIGGTTASIYRTLSGIIEEAVFSAHLSYASSGELFWDTILKTNLIVGGVSILVLLVIIGFVHMYLNRFFHSLKEGIKFMDLRAYAYRMDTKGKWLGRDLLVHYNLAAESLLKSKEEITSQIHSALQTDPDSEGFHKEIRSINDRLRKLNRI